MVKFDKTRSFATIYGHDEAKYEQDGIQYDASYRPLNEKEVKEAEKIKATIKPAAPGIDPDGVIIDPKIEQAGAFLENLLKQGPMAKTVIYAEANSNNQAWDAVQKAAAVLGVKSVPIGTGKIKAEGWSLAEYK